MPYRPTPDRLKELNAPYAIKLIIQERKKTGWTFALRWWDGKTQKRKSLNTQNFSAARKARDRFEAGLVTEKRSQVLEDSNIKLSDFRTAYIEYSSARQHSRDTVKTASWMINALVKFLNDIEIVLITPEMLDDYISMQLSRGRKPRGVVNDLKVFRTAFNWAIRQGWITRNPVSEVDFPRVPRQVPRRLTDDELRKLLNVIHENEDHCKEDRAITLTLTLTGMRINELLSMQWSSVKLPEGYIIITGKGGHERILLIGSLLREVLESLPKYDETNLVFPGFRYHGKTPVVQGKKSYSPLRDRFSDYFSQAGIEKGLGTFHRLRHTVGSSLGDEGYSSLQISKLLGHSSEKTTKIYTTISEFYVRDMVEGLNNKVRSLETDTGNR